MKNLHLFYKFACYVLFFLLSSVYLNAAGETAHNFLKIGIGARQVAMGGASAALNKDITAMTWNPAGLAFIDRKEVLAQHIMWFEGISYEYAGFGANLGEFGAIGLSGSYLSSGQIEKRNELGATTGDSYAGTGIIAQAGYAKYLSGIALGVTAKYISEQIDGVSSIPALAADFGLILYKKDSGYSIGMAYQNLGAKAKFISEENSLPQNFKLGFGYTPNRTISAGIDANFPNDNKFNIGAGFEYNIFLTQDFSMPVRIGYKTANDFDAMSGLSAGVGFNLSGDMLDFAWVPYGDFGSTYRLSLKFKFGE